VGESVVTGTEVVGENVEGSLVTQPEAEVTEQVTEQPIIDEKTKQQLLENRLNEIAEIRKRAEGTIEERKKRYSELLSEVGDENEALKKLQQEIDERAKKEIDELPEIPKTKNEVVTEKGESDFNKVKKDLGFRDTDLKWGDKFNPFGDEMGDMLLS
jgi:hypothetical protein